MGVLGAKEWAYRPMSGADRAAGEDRPRVGDLREQEQFLVDLVGLRPSRTELSGIQDQGFGERDFELGQTIQFGDRQEAPQLRYVVIARKKGVLVAGFQHLDHLFGAARCARGRHPDRREIVVFVMNEEVEQFFIAAISETRGIVVLDRDQDGLGESSGLTLRIGRCRGEQRTRGGQCRRDDNAGNALIHGLFPIVSSPAVVFAGCPGSREDVT